ncbi:permease [Pseudarthrobacter sp. TAF60_1]|uniref:permease n=1 Tax=Pseudarthrobacter sp. TAF60_1 TaxID=3233071 RepID=UPI003F94CF8F
MGQPAPGSENVPVAAAPAWDPERLADREKRRAAGYRRLNLVLAIGVIVAIALLFRTLAPSATAGIEGAARDFFTLAISVIVESLPFVFLGILVSILVQVWLPPDFMFRWLPSRPLPRRMVLSLLGMLMPVCECGNVPTTRGLMLKGLGVGESMTFLFAAPILNPITIITTQQAFGWDSGILVWRIAGGFMIANLIGWLYSRNREPHRLLTPRFEAACNADDHHHSPHGKLRQSVELFQREANAMMPALFIGAGLAGLIQVGVPRNILVALGSDPLWSVLALMVLAFIVSLCSTVDAFFILSFGATFLPGSIVAFLVFGPMIDVKMLALLRTTFTARTLLHLTGLISLCAAVLGWGVNLAS